MLVDRRRSLGCFGIALLGLSGGCGGGVSGERAQPATLEGVRVKLSDAEPCIYNGDSGCHARGLRRRDPVMCVSDGAVLTFDAGGDAERVAAFVGRWRNQDFPMVGLAERERVELPVRRIGGRRFAITAREPLPPSARVLQLRVGYGDDVLTPYTPAGEYGTGQGGPERFELGIYVVRVRAGPSRGSRRSPPRTRPGRRPSPCDPRS